MTPSNRDQSAAEPDAATAKGPRLPGDRIWIGSLALDSVAFEEAVAWSVGYALTRGSRQPARISCPNASLVALADADPGFAKIVRSSNLVVADGAPLLWVALLLKKRLPAQIRGVDLMEGICAAGAARGLSFYILGGLPDAPPDACLSSTQVFAWREPIAHRWGSKETRKSTGGSVKRSPPPGRIF